MDIVLRAVAAYFFIIFMLRIIGRRELSSLGPADLILLVVMGDLIQNGVTQSDMSMTGVTIAVSTFALLTVGSSYLTFKSSRWMKLILPSVSSTAQRTWPRSRIWASRASAWISSRLIR